MGIIYSGDLSQEIYGINGTAKPRRPWKNRSAQQQSRRLQKLRIEIRKVHNLRDQTRPSDDFIFHDDPERFLENTTATKAANYISSTKWIVLHSIAAAAKAAVNNKKNILEWFKPVDQEGLKRIQKWKRDQLVHDAFSKKEETKIEKHGCTNTVQTTITHGIYIALT